MKVWSAIYNVFAVMILIMFSMAYLNVSKVSQRDFDQARLNQAVEFSTEATFRSALAVEDINVDYTNSDVVSINTGDSLDIFESLMCMNYDLSVSDNNKKLIEQSIASIVLTGNDGFYITQSAQDDTTPGDSVKGMEYSLKWSIKMPYLMRDGNNTYALNIGREAYTSISDSGIFEIPTSPGYPSGITKDKALEVANAQIQKVITKEIELKNINNERFNYNFQLPSVTNKNGVNPIDGAGILVLIQGADYVSSEKMNAISVSGYKTIKKINVIAFTETIDGTDRKYYCYQGQMDPTDIGSRYRVNNYYNNIIDAAKDGYAPNYELMTKKIADR